MFDRLVLLVSPREPSGRDTFPMSAIPVAVRTLRASPGYTAVAILTLALGIGVNTAMFSLVDALLFRSGPFPHPEQLVEITATTRQGEMREFAEVEQREIRAQAPGFESLTSLSPIFYSIAEPGRPAERISAITASAEMFATFGVEPMLGRPFTAEETQQGRCAFFAHCARRNCCKGN
jgi:hypothetical protein